MESLHSDSNDHPSVHVAWHTIWVLILLFTT